MRSRYWLGYTMENRRPVLAPDVHIGPEAMIPLLKHNMMEYPHLARFLPDLYREEGGKPLDLY